MTLDDLQEENIRTWCRLIDAPDDLVCGFLNTAAALRKNEDIAFVFSNVRKKIDDDLPLSREFDGVSVEQRGMLAGLAVLSLLPVMNERHQELGIDEEITRATQQDLLVWMEDEKQKTGHWGLSEVDWLRNHLAGRIFRLGRLQFKPTAWKEAAVGGILPGDPVLEVHIPVGGKMKPHICHQSLAAAPEFFRKHFPEIRFNALTCVSWLLDPALAELLPADSNIIQFQKLWTLYPCGKNERQACERVFGRYPVDPETAPQKTELQKKMLLRIRQGRPIRSGTGVISVKATGAV